MNFLKHIFETVSFIRSMPNSWFQRSQALEGGIKELIIENQRNFWVPYAVQFIGLFGFILMLYKSISSSFLASSSSVKRKKYLKNWWGLQTFKIVLYGLIFFLNLKPFHPTTPQNFYCEWFPGFSRCFVCIIECQWCAWNCRSCISDVFHIIWNMIITV